MVFGSFFRPKVRFHRMTLRAQRSKKSLLVLHTKKRNLFDKSPIIGTQRKALTEDTNTLFITGNNTVNVRVVFICVNSKVFFVI